MHFKPNNLYDYLVKDEGGDSLDFFQNLLKEESALKFLILEKITQEVLKQYGPGLATKFRVYKDFQDKKTFSYSGKPIEKIMILLQCV